MGYRVLAGAVMVTHFAFLGYVLAGGFLAWRWRRAIVPHVIAVAWGALVLAVAVPCPLTALESALRRRGGLPPLGPGGFIDHYVEGVWFAERYTVLVQLGVALIVAVSWLGVLRRARPGRAPHHDGRSPARRRA